MLMIFLPTEFGSVVSCQVSRRLLNHVVHPESLHRNTRVSLYRGNLCCVQSADSIILLQSALRQAAHLSPYSGRSLAECRPRMAERTHAPVIAARWRSCRENFRVVY